MTGPDARPPQSELFGRLQALMFLRVIFVSILLGASIFVQVKEPRIYFGYLQTSHFLLIAGIYLLTFVYVILLKYSSDLIWLAYLQLLVDTFFVAAIIYSTGGIDSIFSFLYILTIINGSIILYRKGGMVIATASSVLYGLLMVLHYFHVIHPLGSRGINFTENQPSQLFYLMLVNTVAFYLVAYLSSYLSEQVRRSRVELKAKQIDFNKLEALNKSIISSINSGLITLDGGNRIILFNPASEEIFGIKAERAIGMQAEEVLPPLSEYLGSKGGSFRNHLEKKPSFFDLAYLRPDGEEIHLRFSTSSLQLPSGNEKGRILVFQDMTEIKQIEEEMKKVEGLALIGELAAAIAHEIRNPMASISGSIQMLREGLSEDDVSKRLMEIVLREINRLNHLVNEFLLFARPKKANVRTFNLNQLILESLELFQNSEHWDQKITVHTSFPNNIQIESDPEQVKQVLWNLFLNAIEAMPHGGSLIVSTDLGAAQDGLQFSKEKVRIIVRDTGEGFDDRALLQLFTPFFTTKEGGSGLGLAIVKRIAEGLKGEIWGRNHSEGGAELTMLLPRRLSPVGPVHTGISSTAF